MISKFLITLEAVIGIDKKVTAVEEVRHPWTVIIRHRSTGAMRASTFLPDFVLAMTVETKKIHLNVTQKMKGTRYRKLMFHHSLFRVTAKKCTNLTTVLSVF